MVTRQVTKYEIDDSNSFNASAPDVYFYCPNCNRSIQSKHNFCWYCGCELLWGRMIERFRWLRRVRKNARP